MCKYVNVMHTVTLSLYVCIRANEFICSHTCNEFIRRHTCNEFICSHTCNEFICRHTCNEFICRHTYKKLLLLVKPFFDNEMPHVQC